MADLVQIFRENQHLLAGVQPLEPRENLPRFVGEARYVADFASRAKAKLLRVGVPRVARATRARARRRAGRSARLQSAQRAS
jgi:hypothetical protein